ncbi:hypothetical protein [Chitinophaga sp. CF418]|uniref:hypothetical protein n=1 Tax=Chitinophaga sp. CF418 TaxID=1855287 RepID=UPI0009204923|nr:hypothetical protein [Chitinophaga sp. CF418]SHN46087.1 hypothetical protein SAMN05216311_122112 [Chitinophaga sp. CF418]
MGSQHLYTDIWRKEFQDILALTEFFPSSGKQLSAADFEAVGNRKRYAFRLEIADGMVVNNIDGSAVARDLAEVLLASEQVRSISTGKRIVIAMSSGFYLSISLEGR